MLSLLPNELIQQILEYVSYKDLISISETSRILYSQATDPWLWRNFDFYFAKKINRGMECPKYIGLRGFELTSKTIALPRFKALREFEISMGTYSFSHPCTPKRYQEVDNIIAEISSLKLEKFILGTYAETNIDDLIKVVENSKKIEIFGQHSASFSTKILRAVKTGCANQISISDHAGFTFSLIDPLDLANTIYKLEWFEWRSRKFLNKQQEIAVINHPYNNSNLTTYISGQPISKNIPVIQLKEFIKNLTHLEITLDNVNQFDTIIQQIAISSNLKRFSCKKMLTYENSNIILPKISPDILGTAINNLEEFSCDYSILFWIKHFEAIFQGLTRKESKIKVINYHEKALSTIYALHSEDHQIETFYEGSRIKHKIKSLLYSLNAHLICIPMIPDDLSSEVLLAIDKKLKPNNFKKFIHILYKNVFFE